MRAPAGRPGPARKIEPELFLVGGAAAVRERASRARLGDLLNLRLADVLEHTAVLAKDLGLTTSRLSPPMLYRRWGNFNDYLVNLVSYLFNPSNLDTRHLRDRDAAWQERLKRHVRADQSQNESDSGLWFGLFGGADDPDVRRALKEVYDAYDSAVVPALQQMLHDADLTLTVSTADLAASLTALTEGVALRQLADPDGLRDPAALLATAATALVQGLQQPVADGAWEGALAQWTVELTSNARAGARGDERSRHIRRVVTEVDDEPLVKLLIGRSLAQAETWPQLTVQLRESPSAETAQSLMEVHLVLPEATDDALALEVTVTGPNLSIVLPMTSRTGDGVSDDEVITWRGTAFVEVDDLVGTFATLAVHRARP